MRRNDQVFEAAWGVLSVTILVVLLATAWCLLTGCVQEGAVKIDILVTSNDAVIVVD